MTKLKYLKLIILKFDKRFDEILFKKQDSLSFKPGKLKSNVYTTCSFRISS